MSILNYYNSCRVCKNEDLLPVLNLGNHYLHGSFVYPDFNPPTRKFPVELVRCNSKNGGCGLVQLKHSIDPDILYARYGYRSSTNNTMREHLSVIVEDLLKFKSTPISCLDIGCNDGYLLSKYPKKTYKTGIDPCDIGKEIKNIDNFKFVNDSFPSKKIFSTFDVITMIACFYDVVDPINVVHEIKRILNTDGICVVEVSYWPEKMTKGAIDECVHEHINYFNYQNLEYIFNSVGLKIFNVFENNINGGSIQLWICHNNVNLYDNLHFKQNILSIKFKEANLELDTDKPYREFKTKCENLKRDIFDLFSAIESDKHTVHLLGSSTKGNVLLQYLGLNNENIPYASERSKEKWGAKTLGTNIQIISEEESRKMNPDYYFVPIWAFKTEIVEREKEFLSKGGKLIFPLPELEMI